MMPEYDMKNDDIIAVPDTNAWGEYWVGTEAYGHHIKKKKAHDTVFDPAKIVGFIDEAIENKKIIIPWIIAKEIHGVIKHKFSGNKNLNLGKNKAKILEKALKKAEKMCEKYKPQSIDYSQKSYDRAEAAYENIRNDDSKEMLAKKTRWARKKHRKKWEELGILRKTQPPHDKDINPERKDIQILASAVEAAGSGRSVLITNDGDFTIFSEKIGQLLPVDVVESHNIG